MTDRIPQDFPNRVKGLRLSLGLSRSGLARLMGISDPSLVDQWEKRQSCPSASEWQSVLRLEALGMADLTEELAEQPPASPPEEASDVFQATGTEVQRGQKSREESVRSQGLEPTKHGEACWRRGFERLRTYAEREGRAVVPYRHVTKDGYWLGLWAFTQRKAYRQGALLPERRKALEELPGWTWESWRFSPRRVSTDTPLKYDKDFLDEIGDAEEWRPVSGFGHEFYQVSNLGRVRRNGSQECRHLDDSGGVLLSVGGKLKRPSIARMVWQAFSAIELGEREIIRFRDGNRENRRFDNLYTARQAPPRHCYDQMPRGEDHGVCKLTESAVRHIRATAAELGYTKSVYRQLGEQYGVDPTTVRDAAQGKTWKWLK